MICRLLDQIAKACRPAGFPDVVVGVLPATPPHIALYPGNLTASRASKDALSEPRPRAWQQDIAPIKGQTAYQLDKTPLSGTVRCQAVYDQDKPQEYSEILIETGDYSVDYKTPAVSVTAAGVAKLDSASVLRAGYSFAGVHGVQEFRQFFYADVLAASLAEAEQWSSLLTALTLMSHDTLVAAFNGGGGGYQSGDFVSVHLLDGFSLLETSTMFTANTATVRLTFEARGQLELSRGKAPEFGLIEKIVSRGRTSTSRSVDIDVKTG